MASILVVDDNQPLRAMIERGLTRAGHEVVAATNGRSALAILPKLKFDLILTDIVMPDMEGLELIRSIRKMNFTTKIVAMSGGGRGTAEDYLTMAKQFGATETLEKPFDIETLTRTVDRVIGTAS